MGKHYQDPKDKPPLSHGVCSGYLIQTAVERNCSLYAMDVPANLITNMPQHQRMFLSRQACLRNIDVHNNGRINKINNGNKRKARLLVYTAEECLVFWNLNNKENNHE